MTELEALQAASVALKARNDALHAALAAWLDDTAQDLTDHLEIWRRAYEPTWAAKTNVIDANTQHRYAYPLAVAHAVLNDQEATT